MMIVHRPATLTLAFAHPHIEPIVLEGVLPQEHSQDTYLVVDEADVQRVVDAMVAQSEGRLKVHYEDVDMTGYVLYDTDTEKFTVWARGDHRDGRYGVQGYILSTDPRRQLPYISSVSDGRA